MQAPQFDWQLIQKYNRSGPRYTSYPTALEFRPLPEPIGQVEATILQQRDPRTPLSLYIHIPFCKHLCYYCACNKIITKKNANTGNYLMLLKQEIAHKRRLLATVPPDNNPSGASDGQQRDPDSIRLNQVHQLHLGGGTPTFLTAQELVELWTFLHSQFEFSQEETADYSIEIDPRELGSKTLSVLRQLGFNRLSIGVQDLNKEVQIAVNRVQSIALISEVVQEAHRLGFRSISMDLIYGLPKQTPDSFAQTLSAIIDLSPDRLSLFNYAHLPSRFKPQQRIDADDLPSSQDKLTILEQSISQLVEAGYQYIGLDHFAKVEDSLAVAQRDGTLQRNFQGYTTHAYCDLLGFGVSAISQIGRHYLQNTTKLDRYQQTIEAGQLPAIKHFKSQLADRLRHYVIMQLLCQHRLEFQTVNNYFGIDAITYFVDELTRLIPMQEDGLLTVDAAGITIRRRGQLLARNIAMVFDAYLNQDNQQRFSKTI